MKNDVCGGMRGARVWDGKEVRVDKGRILGFRSAAVIKKIKLGFGTVSGLGGIARYRDAKRIYCSGMRWRRTRLS